MIPPEAFQKLKSELHQYNISEVAKYANVPYPTICSWLGPNSPQFPLVKNFIAVCEAIGLEIKITIR